MMREKDYMIILLFLTSCSACNNKYYMANMLGDENVDVSSLIKNKGYKPIYCGKQICALKNMNPYVFSVSDINDIKEFIIKDSRVTDKYIDTDSIINNLLYKESYLITYKPVDIFNLNISTKYDNIFLEVRIEEKKIILPDSIDSYRFVVKKSNASK